MYNNLNVLGQKRLGFVIRDLRQISLLIFPLKTSRNIGFQMISEPEVQKQKFINLAKLV